MTHRIWSLDTQQFLVVKMSDNNPPEITFTRTGNEDGTGDKGSCLFKKKEVSTVNTNGYGFVFQHNNEEYALHKHKNGNITAKETGTRDPDWTEIIFVPDEFDELKALTTVSPKAKECLTTDSNGNLSFKAFDANHLQPAAGALFVVSKHI